MKTLLAAFILTLCSLSLYGADRRIIVDKDHSRIEVEAKATLHTFSGKLGTFDTDILANAETGKITKALLRFRIADLKTGDDKRDRDMLVWAQEDQFPEVVYSLVSIDPGSSATNWNARGQLILRGVAREVTFPVSIVTQDQLVFSIDGATTLDTQEFGLPIIRKFGLLKVDPSVRVTFHLQGTVSSK